MHVSAAAYFSFLHDIINFMFKLWCIIFVLPVILPGVMLQTVKVVFMVYFVACCRLFSSVLHTVQWCSWPALWRVADCLVVFMVCFVVCYWLFSVHGLLCGVLQRLFSGVHGPLCDVLQTVQWCTWSALWCVADCSVVWMACFVVCCWLFSGVNGMLCGVLLTVQWCVADCSVVWMVRFWLMTTYIALFSALLSRLTALACGSTRVTSFIALFFFFFNIH